MAYNKRVNTGPFFMNDAIGLTIAADQQFIETPAPMDVVWQLETEESAPISLMSTLGLQARSFQVMPLVSLNKIPQEKIRDFFCQPRIDKIFSNYLKLTVAPFQDVEAVIEFWVRAGDWLQGRTLVTNHGVSNIEAGARLSAKLIALQGVSELKPVRQGYQSSLKGQTGNLTVNLTMEGQTKTLISPTLSLEQTQQLVPGQSFQVLWQCEILPDTAEGKNDRKKFAVNWEGEIARLGVVNQSRMVNFTTPHADWDAVLYSNQNQAFQLLRKTASGEVRPDKTRNIHSAFTLKSAASLNNLSGLELWQLIGTLLPSQAELGADLLAEYLELHFAGLSTKPGSRLPFPCVVDLSWRVHQQLQKKEYLARIYPALKAICLAWFSPENDRDQDGIPEWATIEQCGLTSLPGFDLLSEDGFATRISFTEQINLAALLAAELDALKKIAQVLDDQAALATIDHHLNSLNTFIADFADAGSGCFDYQRRKSHDGEILFQGKLNEFGQKSIYLVKPARLNLRLKPQYLIKKPPRFYLHGENQAGDQVVEPVEPANLLWLPGSFFYTTNEIYVRIDKITQLTFDDCHLQIHQADLQCHDIGTLLAKDANDQSLQSLLTDGRYGLPENLDTAAENKVVNLGWNLLVLANLIRNNEVDAAFKLLSQLIQAQVFQLKAEHSATDRWGARSGRSLGLRNTIGGLLPVSLVLDLAGIRILNQSKVSIRGQNPFPWPIKIQYRGMEITRDGKNATIRFQDGSIQHHFGSSQKTFTAEPVEPASM